jgi:putative pyruvate formate lyase activating enzyme
LHTKPSYVDLYNSGDLDARVLAAKEHLECCSLCPRRCSVNRLGGEIGHCGVGPSPKVAAMSIHHWEEPPISGSCGSGTIFFSGCSLKCRFCQNYPISQLGVGRSISVQELARGMLSLQKRNAHNINLVTPTHQLPAFLEALSEAIRMGLNIPIVYNSSGYERAEVLCLLEGIVDVYLPDIKYADPAASLFCSGRSDYVQHNRSALMEMWRQVGPLKTDADGIARSGMIIRHLVLPSDLSGTSDCLRFISTHFGPSAWLSLMSQYFPAYMAADAPPLDRKVTDEEYEKAFMALSELGLREGFVQERGEYAESLPA